MLNISPSASSEAACGYYGKCQTEQESVGSWHGKGAESLGLSGPVDLADFKALCRNRTPTGAKLTRNDADNRRPLYDFTFSAPKSVSIVHQVFGDDRIMQVMRDAVGDAMRFVESKAGARITRRKREERVNTGSIAWVDFYHKLSRPVSGIADPGDHVHACVMNVTEAGGKRYAVDLDAAVKASGMARAIFHNSLARGMRELGYETRRTATAFELAGIDDNLIRKFSKRQDQINHAGKIKAPKARAAIAALTRERKNEDLTADRLLAEWLKRLSPEERRLGGSFTRRFALEPIDRDAEAVESTLGRFLRDSSAVPEETLLGEALRQNVGQVSLEGLQEALGVFIRAKVDGVDYVTTPDAMRKEREIVDAARRGEVRVRRRAKAGLGEIVADKLGLSKLYELVQEGPVTLVTEKTRLYSDNTKRGEALVFLEDIAGLDTGQRRPMQPFAFKAMAKKALTRAKRITERFLMALEQGVERGLDPRAVQRAVER